MSLQNVDINDPTPANRAKALKLLVKHVVDEFPSDAARKAIVITFLMRVAWHEGNKLLNRRQSGGGPGRSFFQFEPGKAKDGLTWADTYEDGVSELGKLMTPNLSETELKAEAATLIVGMDWPANSRIERVLGGPEGASDLFACYLCRYALLRRSEPIPENLEGQAEYWAKYWKVKFDVDDQGSDAADRAAKMAQFRANAQVVDGLG